MSDTFGLIKKLQERPKDARRRIGFFIAGCITLVIFLFWIATLGSRFGSEVSSTNSGNQERILTPFETVGESFGRIIENARENFSNAGF